MTSLEIEIIILENRLKKKKKKKCERKEKEGQERNIDDLLFTSLKRQLVTGLSVCHVNSSLVSAHSLFSVFCVHMMHGG